MFSRFSAVIKRRPVVAAGAALGARFLVGDLIAQQMQGNASIDYSRLGTFGLYGVLMGAGPMYAFFGKIMPVLTSKFQSNAARCACFVALDVGVFMPMVCFPCYYVLREAIKRPDDLIVAVHGALQHYQANVWEDLRGALAVFIPQDILVQTCIPPHLRVPFLSLSGLVWVVIFSSARGSNDQTQDKQDKQVNSN